CSIAESFGGGAVVHITDGSPATNNTPEWVALAEQVARKLQMPFVTAPDSLSGEDFAFYQQNIPGAFIQIGTGIGPMMHNPAFRADPDALELAVQFGVQLVQEALEKLKYVESC
ncbi:MAG: M20/M25/M40 family metallo-hydrolase, partial [Acidaminococcaceae bacterium]|nr:M20/M25/M40 family metallo-hydrolase [Acidaminococcaceae bacterium]